MYSDLIDLSAPAHCFAIKDDCTVRNQIHSRFGKRASSIAQLYRKNKGTNNWKKLDDRVMKFHLFEDQLASFREMEEEITSLHNDLDEWRCAYSNLEEEKRKLAKEMKDAMDVLNEKVEQAESHNIQLMSYIDILEKKDGLVYKGKDISAAKNKKRTLNAFLSRAEIALWFGKSFGIEVQALKVKESNTGKVYNVEMKDDDTHKQDGPVDAEMSPDDMSKIEEILYLLDKFCVGDEFYHQLTMHENGLPRSYLIKQQRNNLDSLCHITATPGPLEGSQVSFESFLIDKISAFKQDNPDFNFENNSVKLKISGDGARMTRKSNYVLLTCALLDNKEEVMSAKGNHTLAVFNGPETYDNIKSSFSDMFSKINHFIDKGSITIDDQEQKLEFFIGGDYKFLLTVMGLKGATSLYACLWCKVHKNNRWETDKHFTCYNSPPMMRTLSEIKSSKGKKNDFSCIREPLLNIPLSHVIVDELHLLLRVMDILIDNIITEVVDWDKEENFEKRGKHTLTTGAHLKRLINEIRGCGVGFDVWEQKNPSDNKTTGKYDFTSLLGNDKKKLLILLPEKLPEVLRPETSKQVQDIWEDFRELYMGIIEWEPNECVESFWLKASNWITIFVSLRDKRLGYEKKRVTPYMHILVAHVPHFLLNYKSLKIFTGQGVEKNNDSARNVVLHKSNNYDCVGDVLRSEHRQWKLKHRERQSRTYTKRNTRYWDEDIYVARSNKKRRDNT